jgi:hypothetical protein
MTTIMESSQEGLDSLHERSVRAVNKAWELIDMLRRVRMETRQERERHACIARQPWR